MASARAERAAHRRALPRAFHAGWAPRAAATTPRASSAVCACQRESQIPVRGFLARCGTDAFAVELESISCGFNFLVKIKPSFPDFPTREV